jgi:radical SAM protein with 4Fe4S-binding SPASM domain
MSSENYAIILGKIEKYAREIHLYNYGEPFLNKELIGIISMTSAKNIRTTIHSNLNAKLFDDSEARRIVESGLSVLSGSIDGANQETYGMYRLGGDIEKCFYNLKQLQSAKKKLKSKTPFLCWSFLINKYNEHEIDKARKMAGDLGVGISFNRMDIWGNEDWASSYHKDPGKLARLRNRMRIYKLASWSSAIYMATGLLQRATGDRKAVNKQPALSANLPYFCSQPFNIMVINWDGKVLPCCTIYDDRAAIGNLLTDDIAEIWNNAEFKKCRDFLRNFDGKKRCGSVCELGLCGVSSRLLQ